MQDEKNPQTGWVFTPGSETPEERHPAAPDNQPQKPDAPAGARASWSASEYISNPKNAGWFGLLGVGSIITAGIVYFVTRDIVSTVVIGVLGITVGIFAARQPRVLEYHIDEKGIHIGGKFYFYGAFRSFSVVQEGAFSFISLMPLKRFMPPLAIHFSPEDEEKIISVLGDYLPYEEHKRDMVESVSRRLRF
jgi:hypothetical protein